MTCLAIDGLFLVAWFVAYQWIDTLTKGARVENVSPRLLTGIQIAFAFITLFPIATYILADLYAIYSTVRKPDAAVTK